MAEYNMKKLLVLFFLLLLTACNEGGDDDGSPPEISSVRLARLIDGQYVETSSFEIGDAANILVIAVDPDLDMDTMYIDEYLSPDFKTPFDSLEIILSSQVDPTTEYLLETAEITGQVGSYRDCFLVVDSAGNESNEFCVNYMLTEDSTTARSLSPSGGIDFSSSTIDDRIVG